MNLTFINKRSFDEKCPGRLLRLWQDSANMNIRYDIAVGKIMVGSCRLSCGQITALRTGVVR